MMDSTPEQPARILIVEDCENVALSMALELRRLGYDPIEPAVPNAADAVLRAVQEPRPDLVLMDIVLAGEGDGIMAAALIRERSIVPIVFITGDMRRETFDRAQAVEPAGFIYKPYKAGELRVAIELALHRHRLEREIRAEVAEALARVERVEALACEALRAQLPP